MKRTSAGLYVPDTYVEESRPEPVVDYQFIESIRLRTSMWVQGKANPTGWLAWLQKMPMRRQT